MGFFDLWGFGVLVPKYECSTIHVLLQGIGESRDRRARFITSEILPKVQGTRSLVSVSPFRLIQI